MTDTNQKLREALQAGLHYAQEALDLHDMANQRHPSTEPERNAILDDMRLISEALALPTTDHIPDAGEMVVDHLPDAGKMIETAAPVGELERADYVRVARIFAEAYGKHEDAPSYLPKTPEAANDFEPHGWVIAAMMQTYSDGKSDGYARAALSAGDAVDGLPVLPKAERIEAAQFCDDAYWFSAEQMTAYATAAVQQYKEDAQRLDFIEKSARCDPKMDGQHVWWPTSLNKALKGPTLRDAIDAAMRKGQL